MTTSSFLYNKIFYLKHNLSIFTWRDDTPLLLFIIIIIIIVIIIIII